MTDSPLLSIIITAYTTERLNDIYELLKSIKIQTYLHTETLFVVEGSKELFEKISTYGIENNIPNLKVLFNDGEPGLSAARNVGIKQAGGDIIAFVDDDVLLYPDWAGKMVMAYNDDSIIGVTGSAIPLWEDPSMSWFPEEFYWIISCTAWDADDHVKEIRNAWGMNMSFRREAFEKAGLFKTNFGLTNSARKRWFDPPSEDVDFSIRVKSLTKKSIYFLPSVRVKHKAYKYRLRQRFILQRSFSVGYQRFMLKKLYKNIEGKTKVLNQERSLLKRIIVKLLPGILSGVFIHPLYSLRRFRVMFTSLTFITIGYGYGYITSFKNKL
jgi:glycosyltransferase involved in cell wall biosynthesis